MAVANITQQVQNMVSNTSGVQEIGNVNQLADAKGSDITNFNSAVISAINENNPISKASTVGGFAVNRVLEMVDTIKNSRTKISAMVKNYVNLGPRDLLDLQITMEHASSTTQVLSKVVSATAKNIDSLTKIQ